MLKSALGIHVLSILPIPNNIASIVLNMTAKFKEVQAITTQNEKNSTVEVC